MTLFLDLAHSTFSQLYVEFSKGGMCMAETFKYGHFPHLICNVNCIHKTMLFFSKTIHKTVGCTWNLVVSSLS
ncbi:hypothetical protein VIGAN_UM021200, partial [Vigna angularis var. angularis]